MDLLKTLGLTGQNKGASTGENAWFSNTKNRKIISINPATEEVIAEVFPADESAYETIMSQAQDAFNNWRLVPAPKRGEIIREIAEELRKLKSELGSLVALEMGKSKQEGDGEIQEMIDIADFAVGQSRMLYGKTMPSERVEHRLYEQWQPLGIVGVLSSFNFPVAVWAWNAFIAAICGDTIVWKPSSKTPLCAIAIQHLCNRVFARHHLSGVFNLLITDDHTLSAKMLDDSRLPLISFTGSTETGRQVNERVAKRLGKTLLELGGNNAIIINEDADLNLAIPAVVFGAIGTAGQRCTSARRLMLHKKIYAHFIERLIHAYKQIKIGDPLDPKNLMGPLIDGRAVENYKNAISRAKQLGGELIYGGQVLAGKGYFVEPTIVRAENHWDIVQQETFAPILYVMNFESLDEAIHLQNNVKQGLSSALFTNSMRAMELFLSARGSDCGLANINMGTSGAEIGGAFGGEKDTGGGRESGSDVWKTYMRRQTVTINWGAQLPLAQGIEFHF